MSLKLNQITLSLIACLAIITLTLPTHAKEDLGIGLYVNLSTDDTVKAGHAFAHAGKLMQRGHAVTYFLNGKAALIAVKGAPQASFKGKSLQDWLKTQISNGGATCGSGEI